MRFHRFCVGQRLLIAEREYIVEQELCDGNLQLRDIAVNTYVQRSRMSLLNLFAKGGLKFLHDDQTESYAREKMGKMLEADITLLPEKIKSQFERRYAYVRGAIEMGINRLTADAFGPPVKAISHLIGDPKPPSPMQVYRWHRDYRKSGENIRALIPMFSKRGNREQLTKEELEEITPIIRANYLTRERHTIKTVHEAVVAEIGRQNEWRDDDQKLRIPSYPTVCEHVKKLDPYEVMKARYGKLMADRQFDPMKKGPKPKYPLERVEIDHTKLDLMVVDGESKMLIGRPWLTSAIDVFSRCVVGIYISFNPPSYLSVMKCMLNAILPKGYVEEEYEGIKYKWDVYGLMGTIVVDNGREFWSKDLEDACLQLGIEVQYAPVKLAWYKGTVERYFGTLNTGLLHGQPGTTFSNIVDKGDYDPKKNAVISLPALRWAIHKWIIDVYHRRPHRGLKGIPRVAWEEGIKVYPPAMPASVSELRIMLGMTDERTITRSGIEYDGLIYNDENLSRFRRKTKEKGKVKIKIDPEDLSILYVADKLTKTYIPVHAVDQEYTRGLSLWQHKVIKRYALMNMKENCNEVELCIAKAEIQEMVEAQWGRIGKSETRVKMARWLGSQLDGNGNIEEEQRADGAGSQEEQPEGEEISIVMPEAEANHAKGISEIGQAVNAEDNAFEKTKVARVAKEGIMLAGTKENKKRRKGKTGKDKEAHTQNQHKLVNGADGDTTIAKDLNESSEKKAEEIETRPLDLTGWEYSHINR
jgi:putative transposase